MKHEKTIKCLLCLCCLLAVLCAFPLASNADTIVASGTCGDNLTWTLDDTGTLTISGTGTMSHYMEQHQNQDDSTGYIVFPWGSVSYYFDEDYLIYTPKSDIQRVKRVVIKNGVTSIGSSAFLCCTGLTSVTIPDSVTSIGTRAFRDCTGLTSVTIPNSVTSIGFEAFFGCTGLTSVTIPDSVTKVGSYAFSGCGAVLSLTVGNVIETRSLAGMSLPTAQLEEITLLDSVTGFATDAFKDCKKVTLIDIPDGVTSISTGAFYGCTELTAVVIPASVTEIKNNAFYNDSKLKTIIFDGTEQQWKDILIEDGNIALLRADVVFLPEVSTDPETHSPHIWHSGTVIRAATCAETGERERTCIVCGAKDTEVIAKSTVHTWNDGNVTTAATCTKDGVKTFTCTVCEATKTEIVKATGHSWGEWMKLDDTQHQRVCANDNSHVEKENHKWDSGKITTAATCTKDGVKTYTCTVCKGTKTETVNATGHSWDEWAKLDDEQHQRVCANDNSHVEKENHTWNDGTITTSATCTEDGVKTYTCSVCKVTKTETVKATGHSYGAWEKLDDAQHQRVCSNDAKHTEITPHTWDKGTVTKAPTCTEAGETTYNCTVCGATVTVPGDAALGHNWSGWTNLDGTLHKRVCANDPTHVETAEHSWDDGTVTKEPTDEEEGEKTFTCTVCGAEKTEPIPKTKPVNKPGDVDGNGKVESADARLALRASVKLEKKITEGTAAYTAADYNKDGIVKSDDARAILRVSVKLDPFG